MPHGASLKFIMKSKQVKSKKRVADHGEVFTSDREVNAMLDLVKNETERIESRFLEPACGTGNFLAQILNRKLTIVDKRYKSAQSEWEFYAILAISRSYGEMGRMDQMRQKMKGKMLFKCCLWRDFGIIKLSHHEATID